MKKLITISALVAAVSSSVLAQAPATEKEAAAPQIKESHKQAIDAFSNLPEAKRLEFLKKRGEAGVLFKNKRIIECLELTRDIQAIFDRDPQIMNLRGACFVEIRDFDKAMVEFENSLEITGPNVSVLFNKGEVAFVSKKWKTSYETFAEALELTKDNAGEMKQIMEFKQLLCFIALSQDKTLSEEQTQSYAKKVEEYSKLYDFLDDTPYSYYAKASLHFSKDDDKAGRDMLARANRVYSSNKGALLSWEDTLAEFGYTTNYYNSEQKK